MDCPEGNTDQCQEYKCRKSGVCRQRSRPLVCGSCGVSEEHCKGHRWGGKEGVKAPVKVPAP